MIRTAQKLAFYKNKAAETAKRNPNGSAEYHTWQWHAKHAFKYSGHSARNPKYGFGSDGSMWFHCDIDELPGCRFSGYADDVAGYRSIDHKGWYTDTFEEMEEYASRYESSCESCAIEREEA